MKPETILQSDYLDLIFDERNKAYGAYVLRREYDKRLQIALAGMLTLVLLFAGFYYWKAQPMRTLYTKTIALPADLHISQIDPVEPIKLKSLAQPKVATIKNLVPLIVPETEATDPNPTVEELDNPNKAIGVVNREGEAPLGIASPNEGETGNGLAPTAPAEEESHVYVKSEIMPEFPGGNAALYRYLQKKLQFQFEGVDAGDRLEIRCRFVIDKEGRVSGIEIMKSAGIPAFEKEVMKVVQGMPQWKPGFQNGHPVNVYFTIPVVVEVPED